jgi:hypothetical protein
MPLRVKQAGRQITANSVLYDKQIISATSAILPNFTPDHDPVR